MAGLQWGGRAGEQPHRLAQPCCGGWVPCGTPREPGGAGVQGRRHVRVQDWGCAQLAWLVGAGAGCCRVSVPGCRMGATGRGNWMQKGTGGAGGLGVLGAEGAGLRKVQGLSGAGCWVQGHWGCRVQWCWERWGAGCRDGLCAGCRGAGWGCRGHAEHGGPGVHGAGTQGAVVLGCKSPGGAGGRV